MTQNEVLNINQAKKETFPVNHTRIEIWFIVESLHPFGSDSSSSPKTKWNTKYFCLFFQTNNSPKISGLIKNETQISSSERQKMKMFKIDIEIV